MPIANLECPACECQFQVSIDPVNEENRSKEVHERTATCPDCGIAVRFPKQESGQARRATSRSIISNSKSSVVDIPNIARSSSARSSRSIGSSTTSPVADVPIPKRLHERRSTPPKPGSTHNIVKADSIARTQTRVARPSASRPDERVVVASAMHLDAHGSTRDENLQSSSVHSSSPHIPTASRLARKRSGWRLGILLITAGGSLVALLAVALILTQVSWGDSEREESENLAAAAGGPDSGTGSDRNDPVSSGETMALSVVEPATLQEVWTRTHPYLVRLIVDRDGDSYEASGVIVDNRGWVATSLPAVAGAQRISLSRASASGTDQGAVEAALFQSRGFIAVDPRNHVAILSFSPVDVAIDRDPVLSIDEFPAIDSVLLASGVPHSKHPWLSGCKLNEKREVKADAISELARIRVEDSGLFPINKVLDGDPESLEIMVLDLPVEGRLQGGPLLRLDGAIAGILVSPPNEESTMWGVSITHVRRLIEFSRDLPVPFDSAEVAVLQDVGVRAKAQDNTTEANNGSDLHGQNLPPQPGTLTSRELLLELLGQCRDAGWSPRDTEEYLVFQQLCRYLTAAEEVVVDETIDEGLRLLLDQVAKEIRDEISRSPWPEEEMILQVNQMAIDSLSNPEDGFYGFAKVVLPPGLAPEINGAGSVVMQLLGHNQRIILPVTRSFDQLRTDTEWLIIGTNPGGRKLNVEDAGTSRSMALIHAIHVNERPTLIVGEDAE